MGSTYDRAFTQHGECHEKLPLLQWQQQSAGIGIRVFRQHLECRTSPLESLEHLQYTLTLCSCCWWASLL